MLAFIEILSKSDLKTVTVTDVNDDLSRDGSVTVVNNLDGTIGIIENNITDRNGDILDVVK